MTHVMTRTGKADYVKTSMLAYYVKSGYVVAVLD